MLIPRLACRELKFGNLSKSPGSGDDADQGNCRCFALDPGSTFTAPSRRMTACDIDAAKIRVDRVPTWASHEIIVVEIGVSVLV